MRVSDAQEVRRFAQKHQLEGMTKPSILALIEGRAGFSVSKAQRFIHFQNRINADLLQHPVITNNRFTRWFRKGALTPAQVKFFIIQFSVFSNQFLIAQLYKTINADTLESMRASKEILANEIGVVFNTIHSSENDKKSKNSLKLVASQGTVEGGTFHFRAAHFEWLLQIAEKTGLKFNEVGKRHLGTNPTLFFCDELIRLYGSSDYQTSQAASYAVENWAAAGFWKELIEGLTKFNQQSGLKLPLAFFTWHDRIEAQHAKHTQEELEALYSQYELDEDKFIRVGNEMLDAVEVFWNGLDDEMPRARK